MKQNSLNKNPYGKILYNIYREFPHNLRYQKSKNNGHFFAQKGAGGILEKRTFFGQKRTFFGQKNPMRFL